MVRCALSVLGVVIFAAIIGCGPRNQPANTEGARETGANTLRFDSLVGDLNLDTGNSVQKPQLAEAIGSSDDLNVDTDTSHDEVLGGGGGSAGAPAPDLWVMTREEFLALVKENEQLRADIRATNPKLQLIADGKFDEFSALLEDDPALATARIGYYADKPDPLNPISPPPRGGPSALQLAAKHGALSLVKQLATPEAIADSGEDALAAAANVEIAAALLGAGVQIPKGDPSTLQTPYLEPATRGNLVLCRWIREQAPHALLDIDSGNGQLWRPVGFACEGGHLEIVKWFASQGVPLTLIPGTLTDENGAEIYSLGSSPLARAAAGGDVETTSYLLANGAKADLNVKLELNAANVSSQGKTFDYSPSLCRAAAAGHVEVMKLLMDEGAKVNSTGGLSPLHQAALHGEQAAFQLLLDRGAKITRDKFITRVEENSRIDLLCCAVRGGNATIFAKVIEQWPDTWASTLECPDRYHYYTSRGPLAVAVSGGREALVRLMLERAEFVSADAKATFLNHALATAVETDRVEMVKLLRESGVPLDQRLTAPSPGGEDANQSIAARAAAHGSVNVLRYVAKAGADIDEKDGEGRTILHNVCRKQFAPQPGLFADLAFRLPVIKCRLELGASANAKDNSGRSVLHDAAFFLEPAELNALIDAAATPMVHDEQGETPAAMCQRLLDGKYRGPGEPRPWDAKWDKSDEERSPYNWRERLRVEENLKVLR